MKKISSNLLITLILLSYCLGGNMTGRSPQQEKRFKKKIVLPVDIKYLLYLPKDYTTTGRPFPLILFLHGAGERGSNLNQLKVHGIPKIIETDSNFPFVVVSPQCPADTWWTDHLEALKALLDYIKSRYNIDSNRVYLTGLSMGGFGTWFLAAKYPDDFAAIAPICGGGEVRLALAGKYKMPVWAFHGQKDDVIPIQRSQEMVDAIKKVGGNVEFTIYPELGHNCWDATYSNRQLYEWFLKQSKAKK